MLSFVEIKRNVMATQAAACWGCIHVGSVAVYLGFTLRRVAGWRLEILTPLHRFRWRRGAWA